MAIFDFFKKKKKEEKLLTKKEKTPEQKTSRVSVKKEEKIVKKSEKKEERKEERGKKIKFSYNVIKNPHLSEKASYLSEKNQYVFKIAPRGFDGRPTYPNKKEIKEAIEGIYNVDVLSVRTIKIPRKKRRLGRIEGFRKSYKKAIVKIKEGQKIDIL